jgi:hypothetical protein
LARGNWLAVTRPCTLALSARKPTIAAKALTKAPAANRARVPCGQSCHGQQHAGHGHGGLERVERRDTIDHDAGRQRHQQPGRTLHRNDQSDDVRPATEKGCDNQRGTGQHELVRTAKARSDGGETVKGGWKHGVSSRLSPGLNHERAMSGHPISGTAQSEV